MRPFIYSSISVLLETFCFASSANAYSLYGSSSSGMGIEAEYQSLQRMDYSMSSITFPFAPGSSYAVDGNVLGQRALLNLSYKSGSLKFTATGGVALNGQFNVSSTSASTLENLVFDTSIVYGAALGWDILGESPFHLRPRFNYLHTTFKGTRATGTTGSCTYDYSSGTPVGIGCNTVSGLSLTNGVTYGMQNDIKENVFNAGLEIAMDFGGVITLFGGAEETFSTLSGTSTITAQGATQPSAIENMSFSNAMHEGVYAGLSVGLGGVRVSGKYTMLSQQSISGGLGLSF